MHTFCYYNSADANATWASEKISPIIVNTALDSIATAEVSKQKIDLQNFPLMIQRLTI